MIDVMSLAEQDTRLKRVARNEYAGPCPGCGGTDRFHVNLKKKDGGAWMCRVCFDASINGWGDAIQYCRHFKNMTFPQAKAYVQELEVTSARVEQAIKQVETYGKVPDEKWQERAHKWTTAATARLWSPDGLAVLEYLHSRGLTDKTIQGAKLGYARVKHPMTKQVVPCVVFPWLDRGMIWRVQCRDITPNVDSDKRYFQLPGSSNAGLYLADSLLLRRDMVLMVEGELDALIATQECGDLAAVVATGTTKGSRTPKWIGRLALVNCVLVAYDADKDGEKNAAYWTDLLDNAMRYRPLEHDVNAMFLADFDLHMWIEAAQEALQEASDLASLLDVEEEETGLCATCYDLGIETMASHTDDNDGLNYCEKHIPGMQEPVQPAQIYSVQELIVETVQSAPKHLNVKPLTGTKKEQLVQFVAQLAEHMPESRTWTRSEIMPASTSVIPAQRVYKSVTLPDSSKRRKCPFEVVNPCGKRDGKVWYATMQECGQVAVQNGWCAEHAYAHTLLAMGAEMEYPDVDLNEHRGILSGVGSWEAYACRVPIRWLKNDLPRVKAMLDKRRKMMSNEER